MISWLEVKLRDYKLLLSYTRHTHHSVIVLQNITCTFNVGAVNLGQLDPNNTQSKDLKPGAKVDLPFWLAKSLSGRNMVSMENPGFYSKRFTDGLIAAPASVNLQKTCPYYHTLGCKYAQAKKDKDLIVRLQESLNARKKEIMDKAHYCEGSTHDPFRSKLSFIEKKLFDSVYNAEKEMHDWKNGVQKTSRKRKRGYGHHI